MTTWGAESKKAQPTATRQAKPGLFLTVAVRTTRAPRTKNRVRSLS